MGQHNYCPCAKRVKCQSLSRFSAARRARLPPSHRFSFEFAPESDGGVGLTTREATPRTREPAPSPHVDIQPACPQAEIRRRGCRSAPAGVVQHPGPLHPPERWAGARPQGPSAPRGYNRPTPRAGRLHAGRRAATLRIQALSWPSSFPPSAGRAKPPRWFA